MNKPILISFLLLFFFSLIACRKEAMPPVVTPPPVTDTTTTPPPANADTLTYPGIYTCGMVSDTAVYWRNGRMTSLHAEGFVSKMFVAGNDVYALGKDKNGNGILLWKNGRLDTIASANAASTDIFVDNGDVYIAGWVKDGDDNVACYWKNGLLTELALPGKTVATAAYGIVVSKSNILVAGSEYNFATGGEKALYWNNGVRTELSSRRAYATDIAVDGDDVYICGQVDTLNNGVSIASYWKNGEYHSVISSPVQTDADAIAVVNGDVYIAGTYNAAACYYKNSVVTQLSNQASAAKCIVVYNGDVYTGGGVVKPNPNYPIYIGTAFWKNSTEIFTLAPEDAASGNIFIQ